MSSVSVTGTAVIRRFEGMPEKLRQELNTSIGKLVLKLQRDVQNSKLSGQVLNVRTGRLRRSIAQAVSSTEKGVIGVVSTAVEYAPIHEFGFSGTQTVQQHLRLIKQAFGRQLKAPVSVTVKQHSRAVNLPERSFLRSALADMRPEVMAELEAALSRTIK